MNSIEFFAIVSLFFTSACGGVAAVKLMINIIKGAFKW